MSVAIVSPDTTIAFCVEKTTRNCYVPFVGIVSNDDFGPGHRRRSQRVKVRIPIIVRATGSDKRSVLEKTHTIVLNAHGALILLGMSVSVNQLIFLQNVKTEEELLCRVTTVGSNILGKAQVGVEFITPDPEFWGVASPPKDWKPDRPQRPHRPKPHPPA